MLKRSKIIMIAALVVLIVGLALLIGQLQGRRTYFAGLARPDNELPFIKIYYEAFDDSMFGGQGAKGFRLYITNESEEPLRDMTLTLDDQYRASLSEMIYYNGVVKGSQAYGRKSFPANAKVEFIFSHDVSNHGVFRNRSNETLPAEKLPSEIRVDCARGTGQWEFSAKISVERGKVQVKDT